MKEVVIKLNADEVLNLRRGESIVWISYQKEIKVTLQHEPKRRKNATNRESV
jgi:hypothetical protein